MSPNKKNQTKLNDEKLLEGKKIYNSDRIDINMLLFLSLSSLCRTILICLILL